MLRAALKPSRLLAAILAAVHAGALCLVWLSETAWTLKLALSGWLAFQFAFALRHALLKGAAAVIALEITSDDVLSVETRASGWREQAVLASTFVASYLTVMNLRDAVAGTSRSVVLLRDSLPADDFRRLRVWLRWKAGLTHTAGVP